MRLLWVSRSSCRDSIKLYTRTITIAIHIYEQKRYHWHNTFCRIKFSFSSLALSFLYFISFYFMLFFLSKAVTRSLWQYFITLKTFHMHRGKWYMYMLARLKRVSAGHKNRHSTDWENVLKGEHKNLLARFSHNSFLFVNKKLASLADIYVCLIYVYLLK